MRLSQEYEKLGYSGSLRIEILDVSPTEGDNCIIKLFSTDSGMQPPEINGVVSCCICSSFTLILNFLTSDSK